MIEIHSLIQVVSKFELNSNYLLYVCVNSHNFKRLILMDFELSDLCCARDAQHKPESAVSGDFTNVPHYTGWYGLHV